jgi:SpoVK/Ycf46/Vps4 family AAA+-type ATPase
MARSDLILALVRAGANGDQSGFRRTVEALVAEERAKKHGVLAAELAEAIARVPPTPNAHPINGAGLRGTAFDDLVLETIPDRRLDDLILPSAVESACRELVEEHHRADLLRSYGLEPRHRVLLVGPPGSGKTSLAEAIATECMVPLIVVRYETVIGSYLGETSSRLQRVFESARQRQCVLFFDEFDTLGKERGDVHETGEIKRVVSSLLLQIDRLPSYVLVITATNHPELLDRAVWRRFELRLSLPHARRTGIATLLDRWVARSGRSLGFAPRTLADKLAGGSYAEVEEFARDVDRRAVLNMPDPDIRAIVRTRLEQWANRASPKR